MKRICKVITTAAILMGMSIPALANVNCPYAIRVAINKYKAQDYVGCIQDLEEYSQSDPTNSISYYYTGIAYMKVGMKDKAIEAFEKVSTINSVPILSSYAIQASKCMMEDISPCKYKKYKQSEIEEMVQDPAGFFERAAQAPEQQEKQEEVQEEELTDIDMLIKGQFPENIHPDANKTIQETRLIQEQERVNAELNQRNKKKAPAKTKSDASSIKSEKLALADVSDKEIADAVRTLNKAGYKFVAPNEQAETSNNTTKQNPNPYKQLAEYYALNQDSAEMAMMFGSSNNRRNDSFNQLLPFLLMQEQQNNSGNQNQKKLNPELIKTMMMSSMMGDFDLGFDNDKDR